MVDESFAVISYDDSLPEFEQSELDHVDDTILMPMISCC